MTLSPSHHRGQAQGDNRTLQRPIGKVQRPAHPFGNPSSQRQPNPQPGSLAGLKRFQTPCAACRPECQARYRSPAPPACYPAPSTMSRSAYRHPRPPKIPLDKIVFNTCSSSSGATQNHRAACARRHRYRDRPARKLRLKARYAARDDLVNLRLFRHAARIAARFDKEGPNPSFQPVHLICDVTQGFAAASGMSSSMVNSAHDLIEASGLRSPCATADAISPTTARRSVSTMRASWRTRIRLA